MNILKQKSSDMMISPYKLYVLEADNFKIGSIDISKQDISSIST
jgi:hypothetical protein